MSTKKKVIVSEHPRKIKGTSEHPPYVTIVDKHTRSITIKSKSDLKEIFKANQNRKDLLMPSSHPLDFTDGNKYDYLIAFWTDYFNKELEGNLEPDLVKALIASESGFELSHPENTQAIGIAQITKETLNALLDQKGEVKKYHFSGISQKDLLDPEIAIALAVRWLHRKRDTAKIKLKREPTPEEIALDYKGLLKSKTQLKSKALKNFRENYALLKNH